MRRRKLFTLAAGVSAVLVPSLLLLVTRTGSTATRDSLPATAPAAASRPATRPLLPLVYSETASKEHARLSEQERAELAGAAVRLRPDGRGPWFALVIGRDRDGGYHAIVYYEPERRSGRLRAGRSLWLTPERARSPLGPEAYRYEQYVQVSRRGGARRDDGEPPDLPDLPFTSRLDPHSDRESLPDDELVRVIDAARGGLAADASLPKDEALKPVRWIEAVGRERIVYFGVDGDTRFRTATVTVEGESAEYRGAGWYVH